MSVPTLSDRALGRALLDRQLLLRRAQMPVMSAIEHLLGLQGQATLPPYYGLWSRLCGFDQHELARTLLEREAVRLRLMRGTVHLVSATDAVRLRPLMQVVGERGHNGAFRSRMGNADPSLLATIVRQSLDEAPLTARELGARLVERGVGEDAAALGNAATVYVPLVQVPPRGIWGTGGQARYATLEGWTGRGLDSRPSIDRLVLRYLAAFGPATAMDVQSWSGLTKLGAVLERLRGQLVSFCDERGRELFDLPDAPRPDPRTPAPPRFLGQFDNVLLSHADRRRIIAEGLSLDAALTQGRDRRRFVNHLLIDGSLRASWWLERDTRRRAVLVIRPFARLTDTEREHVYAEGMRMVEFAAADAERRELRFETPPRG